MPLKPSIVGFETPPFHYDIDARWLMAYAAGLGDAAPCYRDSTRPLAMHPVFPVCVEWDAILAVLAATRAHGLSAAECARSVHAEHDLHIYRPLTAGMRVRAQAVVVGVEQRPPGAFLTMRIDTLNEAGELCCRTWQGNLFRDVELDGAARHAATVPTWPAPASGAEPAQRVPLAIPL
ncbi:MAG: hypothetical protein EBU07_15590, partial [Betaproteobacteria bacterium]|nr:hypothetical protein [Betaproteobacteria bacterium]